VGDHDVPCADAGTPMPEAGAPEAANADATLDAEAAEGGADAATEATPACPGAPAGSPGSAEWAKTFGGETGLPSIYYVGGIAADPYGNIVVVGTFYGVMTVGGVTLSSTPGITGAAHSYDVFVAKFNAAGAPLFARAYGDGDLQRGVSVVTDARGDIFITGDFQGKIDFTGTTAGALDTRHTDPRTSSPTNVFLAKLDPAGNTVWSKGFGDSTYSANARRIVVDPHGDLVLGGSFGGAIDFAGGSEGGPGYFYGPGGGPRPFLAKLTTDGAYVWGRSYDSNLHYGALFDLAVDSRGSIYFAGGFIGYIDLSGTGDGPDGAAFLNASDCDAGCSEQGYVSEVSSEGDFMWRVGLPGNGSLAVSVAVDPTDNLLVSGHFVGGLDLGQGDASLVEDGGGATFVAKLDANHAPSWSVAVPLGVPSPFLSAVTTDPAGNVLLASGLVPGAAPGPGPQATDAGQAGTTAYGYVTKLDPTGHPLWSRDVGSSVDYPVALAVAPCAEDVVVGGSIKGRSALPSTDGGTIVLSTAGEPHAVEVFLARLAR
jgi:hypothetical protein